jgi:SNF2 family DNA or RNA helicase
MDKLNHCQRKVVDECLQRPAGGGLSLPMGYGKTLISLVLAEKSRGPCLVVVSKTLLESWVAEICKFYGTDYEFAVYHKLFMKGAFEAFTPTNETIILTTPETLSKVYKNSTIEQLFISYEERINRGGFPVPVKLYTIPSQPFLNRKSHGRFLFSTRWKCLFIDESQNYTNVSSVRCHALASVFAQQKWCLSGTMFNEPKPERILGYHLLIGDATFPNNLPDATLKITSKDFVGISGTLVAREKNDMFIVPQVIDQIVVHDLSEMERVIYSSLKNIMKALNEKSRLAKLNGDIVGTRKFGAYLLAMITYTRQFLVCPLVPFASAMIAMSDYAAKNELHEIFRTQMNEIKLEQYLDDPEAALSTRIKSVVKVVNGHKDERLIIFTCFRTNLNVVSAFIPTDRAVFICQQTDSPQARAGKVLEFEKTKNGLLLLTYQLGAEGLNLQRSSIVLLLDVWWNHGTTQQAIARVLRFGQESKTVRVYFFTANTGIEQALFKKHSDKLAVLKELMDGPVKSKITKMKIADVLKIIELEDNKASFQALIAK